MAKPHKRGFEPAPGSLQSAIDRLNIVGTWDWDVAAGVMRADPLVAILFGVDPELAEAGVPVSDFTVGLHPEDRDRVDAQSRSAAREGGIYVAEYRVCSADGIVRWVLARGNFVLDEAGLPVRGQGIIVDISQARSEERAYVARPIASFADPLERIAEHCIAARRDIDQFDDARLRTLLEPVLIEIGRRIAGRVVTERRRKLQ